MITKGGNAPLLPFLKFVVNCTITRTDFNFLREFSGKIREKIRQGLEVTSSDFAHFHICYLYNSQKQNPKIFWSEVVRFWGLDPTKFLPGVKKT